MDQRDEKRRGKGQAITRKETRSKVFWGLIYHFRWTDQSQLLTLLNTDGCGMPFCPCKNRVFVPLTSRLIPCLISWARMMFSWDPLLTKHHFPKCCIAVKSKRSGGSWGRLAVCEKWPVSVCSTVASSWTISQNASFSTLLPPLSGSFSPSHLGVMGIEPPPLLFLLSATPLWEPDQVWWALAVCFRAVWDLL